MFNHYISSCLLCLLLTFSTSLNAQFTDDFADGDFLSNPVWSGNQTTFKINTSYQLQLNATTAGESYLVTPSTVIHNTEWQFWVKQSFSSSSNNNSKVYIVSDQSDLKGPLNGYFLQIGETVKTISLWKQSGTTTLKIIEGTMANTGGTVNQIRVKVTRDALGNWTLSTDPTGGNSFLNEGTVFDNTFTSTNYFGVVCKYTLSNISKFYYDDFYAGPIQIDSIAPTVLSIKVVSSNQLDVLFSEAIDQSTAETTSNYLVDQGVGIPSSAMKDLQNPALIHLTFSATFPQATNCLLSITNISDLNGNTAASLHIPFSHYRPSAYDIVIHEIMADPDPAVGLPNHEYVELYNRTPFNIDMSGWKFYYGSSERIIENLTISAHGYALLAKSDAQPALASYGNFFGFSSFSISNAGQLLVLKNPDNQIIHSISFTDAWYANTYKKDGGWSLEMIDPTNPCAEEVNWKASTDASGGSPGKINSVAASKPDLFAPEIWYISLIDEFSLKVFFTESLDSAYLLHPTAFLINPGNKTPVYTRPAAPDYKSVSLFFTQGFEEEIIYTLQITDTLIDCAGNRMPTGSSGRFGVPSEPDSADLIINEILFNPKVNGLDFVELYNRSEKIINLGDVVIAGWNYTLNELQEIKDVSSSGYQLFPGDYVVLSTNGKTIKSHYLTTKPEAFIDLASMPSFSNENGSAVLATRAGKILDFFYYEESMHFPMLKSFKGVSLERLNFNRSASEADNWHSASESVGFATPAYVNSQMLLGGKPHGSLSTEPEIFSPDNDGRDDVLLIHYLMEKNGYAGTLSIYDSRGKRVNVLKNNTLLGISGTFSWDGLDENQRKLPIGVYVILLEVFNSKGEKNTFKTTTVLGTRL